MKNHYLVCQKLLFLLVFSTYLGHVHSQINYSENFDAGNGSYTGSFFQFTGATACGGVGGSMRNNLYGSNPSAEMISPMAGNSVGGVINMSYDYKIADWSANTVGTPTTFGSFDVQYGPSATGPWTTVQTVDGTNHIVSGNCATKNVSFSASAGPLYIRFNALWGSGDYYLNFDNISLVESTSPCSGTPAPGNTITSSSGVCPGTSANLSLQNATNGVGVTYQWQSSSNGVTYTAIPGATSAQFTAFPTAPTYYNCIVTCAGNNGTSTGVQITINPYQDCYCVPVTTYGCTDGDVIARVILNTLDNNSGTGCPGGVTGYSDYTTDPLLTTTLQASTNYTCEVFAGQYSEGYAAWIDYNDDGIFDQTTERIGYSNGTVQGSGMMGVIGSSATFPISLACNPPVGPHRLRVRAMFATDGELVTPCTSNFYGEVEDYIITIAAAPPCPSAGLMAGIYTTQTTADLAWLLGCSSATNFDIEYGPSGFTPGTGTILTNQAVTISNDTAYFSLNGLSPNVTYTVYYRANCGANQSPWSGGDDFLTGCSAIEAIGWCEGFDSDSNTEQCWTVLDNNNDGIFWDLNYQFDPLNGDNVATLYTDFNFGANDDYLITPNLILTGNEILNFSYKVESSFEPNDFQVLLSTTGTNPADFTDTLMYLNSYYNTAYVDTSIDLSAYSGNVYIAFHVPSGGQDGWILYIDQVCVDVCIPAPGTDGSVDFCRTDDFLDLNTVITQGQNNGTWSFDANPSILNGSEITTTTLASDTYEAYYIVTTACTSDTTVATFAIYGPSSAGNDGTITACKNQPINLLSGLSGNVDLGGSWYDPGNQLIPSPAITAANFPGQYNYDYITGNGICPDDTANVLLIVDMNCDYLTLGEMALNEMVVYPNPSFGIINIANEVSNESYNFTVSDMNGRQILSKEMGIQGMSTTSIDLSTLENGVYFIRVFNGNAEKVFRLILE